MSYLDYLIIASYLFFSFLVSIFVYRSASKNPVNYFLGGRNLPWWWAGISIAATTFAADTPLAITGLIAKGGLASNWIWLSWIFMHAGVAIFFSSCWRKSEVITDAQLIELRYSGNFVPHLRLLKSAFYGIVFNCIVLAWVIKAMVKIISPFFNDTIVSGYEVYILMVIVAIYSSTGGLQAVVITDLIQIVIAFVGSGALAYFALEHIGGLSVLPIKLSEIYGQDHNLINLIPKDFRADSWSLLLGGWFMIYLIAQSFASNPADGGGYMMQRLGACKDAKSAKKATLLFIAIHYILRVWPWFVVGLIALVIFPIGQESSTFNGAFGYIQNDREAAYPALMKLLLPSGFLGVAIAGMLAAFMSTVDTHLNWGSSYIVNDFLPKIFPSASIQQQVWAGRISVLVFASLGVIISFQIESISSAWEWLAILGASFSTSTFLRWFWWRINATSEILSIIMGLIFAFIFSFYFTTNSFESKIVFVTIGSLLGTIIGAFWGQPTDQLKLVEFVQKINPIGFWGSINKQPKIKEASLRVHFINYLIIVLVIILSLMIGQMIIGNSFL